MHRAPRTLDTHSLPLNTDVAEWCPNSNAARILAVGSYQLDEASQQRLGALDLFRLEGSTWTGEPELDSQAAATRSPALPRLTPLCTLDLPGIFDLRWHPRSAMPQLAAALADGSVRTLTFGEPLLAAAEEGMALPQLPPGVTLDDEGGVEGMAVSLDYSRCDSCAGEKLAVSYSSGQLQLFQATPAGMASLALWQAHQLEAWVAATDHWHPDLLHSGGDDCAYRLWDSRQGFHAPVWQSSKIHGAGVCCIASSPYQEYLACTGSYDDHLRLWDLRTPQRPLAGGKVNTGGGVWRAKWHPTDPQLLLAACMYNGFAVLQMDPGAGAPSILATYEHGPGSLSYGADWCRETEAVGNGHCTLAATCSFYDRLLHLWDIGLPSGGPP